MAHVKGDIGECDAVAEPLGQMVDGERRGIGPIRRTNDARVLLLKTDWNASAKNLATLRYAYTWSKQDNGTFDVDSWGRSANATEKDSSGAITGSLISTLATSLLNEFRFQGARENRPRPYNGPNITGQNRPLPDTAMLPGGWSSAATFCSRRSIVPGSAPGITWST